MELRGFGACEKRSSYAPLAMKKGDWVALAGILLWAACLLAAEVLWRIYA